MSGGKVIVLYGPPAAGKTTLAKAIQERATEAFLLIGMDTFYAMVPRRWAGGPVGEFRHLGFAYVETTDTAGNPLCQITAGPVGERVVRGMHRALRVLASSGNNLVVDGLFTDAPLIDDCRKVLGDQHVWFIKVHAPIGVLEQRESNRAGKLGTARDFLRRSGYEALEYDLELDTSTCSAEVAAGEVLTLLGHVRQSPTGGQTRQ